MKQSLAAVASIALMAPLLGSGPAQAAPVKRYDLDTMKRGADATIDHLFGDTIRTTKGSIVIPPRYANFDSALDYIGRAKDGSHLLSWVPYDEDTWGISANVLKVTPEGVTRIHRTPLGSEDSMDWILNDYRRTYIEIDADNGAGTNFTAFDEDGSKLRTRSLRYAYQRVLDYRGSRAIISGAGVPTLQWNTTTGKKKVLTKKPAVFADLGKKRLAVRSTNKRWAWVSTTRPNRVKWQARFYPMDLTSNGKFVAGWATDKRGEGKGLLQVRRAKNGKVVAQFKIKGKFPTSTVAWETDKAVVFEVEKQRNSAGAAVIRCRVWGKCQLASDVSNEDYSGISFAFENDAWFLW